MAFLGSLVDQISATTNPDRSWSGEVWRYLVGSRPHGTPHLLWSDRAQQSRVVAFSIAVALAGMAGLPLWVLEAEHLLQYRPFIIFYPAIIIATLLGGFLPGLLSVLISAVLAFYLFLSGNNWGIPLVSFIVVSTLIVGTGSLLNLAIERASAYAVLTRAVIESVPNGVLVVDEQGHILAVNRGIDGLFGYDRSELWGKDVGVLIPEGAGLRGLRKAHGRKGTARGLRNGRHLDGPGDTGTARRVNGHRKDGSEFPVEIGLKPVTVLGRDFLLILVTDISEREKFAEFARVERLTTTGEMVASIAHEISQPLSAMVTNGNSALRWLSHEPPNIEEARAALQRIVNDGMRGRHVIGSLRAMLKKGAQQRTRLDVNTLIRRVIELVQGELQTRRISLRAELADNVPRVLGDPIQLSQVVLNLIMNAIEAMASAPSRRHSLQIRSEKHEPGGVRVTVQDSGPGIAPENSDRVFQPFFTTKPEGTGMGLSICRSIVETHGGRISVLPANPHGSVFEVILPKGRTGGSS